MQKEGSEREHLIWKRKADTFRAKEWENNLCCPPFLLPFVFFLHRFIYNALASRALIPIQDYWDLELFTPEFEVRKCGVSYTTQYFSTYSTRGTLMHMFYEEKTPSKTTFMRVCIIRNVFDRTYFELKRKIKHIFLVTYSDSQLFAPNGLIEWPFRSTVKFLGPPTKDLDDRVYDPAVKRIIFHWFAGWITRRGCPQTRQFR